MLYFMLEKITKCILKRTKKKSIKNMKITCFYFNLIHTFIKIIKAIIII